jgi:hypothetical protein
MAAIDSNRATKATSGHDAALQYGTPTALRRANAASG